MTGTNDKTLSYEEAHQDGPADELDLDGMPAGTKVFEHTEGPMQALYYLGNRLTGIDYADGTRERFSASANELNEALGPELALTEAEVLAMQVFEIKRQLERVVSHIEREFTAYDSDPGAALEETRALLKSLIAAYC